MAARAFATFNYLPDLAYFAAGTGPKCDDLVAELRANGFKFIAGPDDARDATELWVEPPLKFDKQISPPGTEIRIKYDTASVISIVGPLMPLPLVAMFEPGKGGSAEAITSALNASGFTNVFGASGREKVAEVWVAPPELRAAPISRKRSVLYDKSSLIVLIGKRKTDDRPKKGRKGRGKK